MPRRVRTRRTVVSVNVIKSKDELLASDSREWLADFERDGYLVVENLVDPATLQAMRDRLDEITANPRALPDYLQRYIGYETDYARKRPQYQDKSDSEIGDAIRILMELPRFGPVFQDLILYDPLLDVLQTLFGTPEFHFHNYKGVFKAPGVSSRFCWHRDLPYLNHTSPNALTAMLCVDEMTPENGATVVLPGTHHVPEGYCNLEDQDIPDEKMPQDAPRVTVCCPAGSAVIFHVNILHGGGANRSDRNRRNVIGIWVGPDSYPVKMERYAFQGIHPRSQDPARRKQVQMSFPHRFG
jgi:ectoine hydroxylase-related dioxygenase (phytanoyl-CoA dioxygenase family)